MAPAARTATRTVANREERAVRRPAGLERSASAGEGSLEAGSSSPAGITGADIGGTSRTAGSGLETGSADQVATNRQERNEDADTDPRPKYDQSDVSAHQNAGLDR